jgi:hypothetical protein
MTASRCRRESCVPTASPVKPRSSLRTLDRFERTRSIWAAKRTFGNRSGFVSVRFGKMQPTRMLNKRLLVYQQSPQLLSVKPFQTYFPKHCVYGLSWHKLMSMSRSFDKHEKSSVLLKRASLPQTPARARWNSIAWVAAGSVEKEVQLRQSKDGFNLKQTESQTLRKDALSRFSGKHFDLRGPKKTHRSQTLKIFWT